ncbi:heterokaryon incompatibility protein-domain-containing protein [Bombardia bombarda]|uniref:Heterokaryon incompatibility protein-domain-containing protein n=1 Tax=Bombardia bombarda TaxID=252184 RepID=A0AA39X0P7_9PEZI|nr:heterokaryon incompatibility protein-domain-containing protein [Bombardia bombarda]
MAITCLGHPNASVHRIFSTPPTLQSIPVKVEMPDHGVTPHLAPFLPYIEKASSGPAVGWRMPKNLSQPIKVETLKSWLSICDTNHEGHCKVSDKRRSRVQHATRLVDVRRRCVVRADQFDVDPLFDPVYVALSYVWGQVSCPSLTTATIEDMETEGSLNDSARRLPRTICDAMKLVADLGFTYLWVDRLCIVQDDEADKQAQIKAMGAIYSNSTFTLVAAQSHDASGPLSSRPLQASSTTIISMTGRLVAKPLASVANIWTKQLSYMTGPKDATARAGMDPSLREDPKTAQEVMNIMSVDLLRTVWFSRGWTFQEFLFARRKIIFHNNTVNWECHCASSHEQQRQPALSPQLCSRRTLFRAFLGLDVDPWPNFHRFARLAALLTPRHFTYPEDVLDAFDGAAAAFAHIYEGGLVTGIPEMLFDAALIWQPYHPLERREPAVISEDEAVLPTWSWISWRGNVQSESWQSAHDYIKRLPHAASSTVNNEDAEENIDKAHPRQRWITISTVDWYHSETLSSRRDRIHVNADHWRKLYDRYAAAPPGWWTKHVVNDDDPDRSTASSTHYFTNDAHLGPDYEFWYPIPIGFDLKGRAARSRYLHCTTRHAFMRVSSQAYRVSAHHCAILALHDARGEPAGCLRLNCQYGDEEYMSKLSGANQTYRLIELSEGSVDLGYGETGKQLLDSPLADVFDEWSLPGWSRVEGVYEFVNVMWIEINGKGIASRLAVGRVERVAWKDAVVGEVEISIG